MSSSHSSAGANAHPAPVGTSFFASSPGAAGVNTLFTGAANTGGAILRTASWRSGGTHGAIYADGVAPASEADDTRRRVWATKDRGALPFPLFIAAGRGLHVAHSGSGRWEATWDLL